MAGDRTRYESERLRAQADTGDGVGAREREFWDEHVTPLELARETGHEIECVAGEMARVPVDTRRVRHIPMAKVVKLRGHGQ